MFNLCESTCAPMRLWTRQIVEAAGADLALVEVPASVLPTDLALTGQIAQHTCSPTPPRRPGAWAGLMHRPRTSSGAP